MKEKKLLCSIADTVSAKMLSATLKIKYYFICSLTISSLVHDQNQQWHLHSEAQCS